MGVINDAKIFIMAFNLICPSSVSSISHLLPPHSVHLCQRALHQCKLALRQW